MSSLAQLPSVTCAYGDDEKIIIVTANGNTLMPMKDLIERECGVLLEDERYEIIGAQDVPIFGKAVSEGKKVDVEKATPHIVKLCTDALKRFPAARAFLFECTELPPYSDAVRHATDLPVYDAITNCDFFMSGLLDNDRFGLNDWQEHFDGQQEEYTGKELTEEDRRQLEFNRN